MPYSIKMIGVTKAQKALKDVKNKLTVGLKKLKDESVELKISGIDITFSIEEDSITPLLKRLPRIMKEAHKESVRQLVDLLKDALNDAMESPVWGWDGDNRDIVDTGKLKASLKIYVDSDDDIHIMYGEDYAAIVHYGGYFSPFGRRNVNLYYPGRPWVSSVLEGGGPVPQFDFEGEYRALMSLQLLEKL